MLGLVSFAGFFSVMLAASSRSGACRRPEALARLLLWFKAGSAPV
jgi:hypothetical protein